MLCVETICRRSKPLPGSAVRVTTSQARSAWPGPEGPRPKAKGAGGLSTRGFNPELSTPFVGGKSASSDLLGARIHSPVAFIVPLEAPLNGANGTQAGSLCYATLTPSRRHARSVAR